MPSWSNQTFQKHLIKYLWNPTQNIYQYIENHDFYMLKKIVKFKSPYAFRNFVAVIVGLIWYDQSRVLSNYFWFAYNLMLYTISTFCVCLVFVGGRYMQWPFSPNGRLQCNEWLISFNGVIHANDDDQGISAKVQQKLCLYPCLWPESALSLWDNDMLIEKKDNHYLLVEYGGWNIYFSIIVATYLTFRTRLPCKLDKTGYIQG